MISKCIDKKRCESINYEGQWLLGTSLKEASHLLNPGSMCKYNNDNCNDEKIYSKYNQLQSLGFYNVYIYTGGLFEWLMLQDIYSEKEFPTTKKELDILKYKPNKVLNNLTNEFLSNVCSTSNLVFFFW